MVLKLLDGDPGPPLRRHHPGRLERIKWTQNPSFFWPSLSTISADDYFDDIHRIISLLDAENITILRTMKEHGPRNLLGIARKAKLPYTTVYNRVTKLESQGVL